MTVARTADGESRMGMVALPIPRSDPVPMLRPRYRQTVRIRQRVCFSHGSVETGCPPLLGTL